MTHDPNRRKPGRPYCEAFPMLDVHELMRAASEGRTYLEWKDEDGLVIGFMSRQEQSADEVTIFYRFFGTQNVEAGTGTERFGIRVSQAGRYWRRPSLVCPVSGRSVTRLYYVHGVWACKTSHGLLNLQQRLDPVNRAIFNKKTLLKKMKDLPRTAKERRKDKKNKQKYGDAFRILLETHRTRLPWYLQYRTTGRWLKPRQVPTDKDPRGDPGYGWEPGMRGQMPGLVKRRSPGGSRRRAASASEQVPAAPASTPVPSAAAHPTLDPKSRAPGAKNPYEFVDLGLLGLMDITFPGLSFDIDPPDLP